MKGVKHSSYLWVADNNWINFAEKWMCFDALVADWQSAGFSPIYHSPFICCCQTFPQPPFQARLIKQLFNKTKRHLHHQRTEQGFTAHGGESWDEYQLTPWHAVLLRWEVWHSIKKIRFDFVHRFHIWLCFTRPRPTSHHSSTRLRLAWLFSWMSSRAALFAAAEFTPLLPLTSFKYICLSFAFSEHNFNTPEHLPNPHVGTDNKPGFMFHVSLR